MDWKIFWKLWLQKNLRNFASMKFQFMIMMFALVAVGMFVVLPGMTTPVISATVGLGFLGAGFITMATSRIIAKTSLTNNDEMDTDK